MKLLIVDDEELTRTGLISSIDWDSLGITEILQADDGVNGLDMARLYKPEIILCDVRMPRMTGIAMLERLEKFLPDSIPIFMSGYSDKEYLKAAIKLKAINYIEKPLHPEEVQAAVLEAQTLYKQKLRSHRGEAIHSQEIATRLAQQLMEHLHIPYLSIDHLKMGLIRSGQTTLTPTDDRQLTDYLWSIVREMVQTVIENHQNLIVEGCYIPFHWKEDFSPQSLRCIRSLFLVMSEEYIRSHFSTIRSTANVIEQRLDDSWCTLEQLLDDNRFYLENCTRHSCPIAFIQDEYPSFEQFCTLLEL